jgi:hypothetical protein
MAPSDDEVPPAILLAATPPEALAEAYVSDLVIGMLETGREELVLERGRPLPYFGFLSGRPLRVGTAAVQGRLEQLIAEHSLSLSDGGRAGVFAVMLGQPEEGLSFRFTVVIPPDGAWLRLKAERAGRMR